jgi:hypothetical protein
MISILHALVFISLQICHMLAERYAVSIRRPSSSIGFQQPKQQTLSPSPFSTPHHTALSPTHIPISSQTHYQLSPNIPSHPHTNIHTSTHPPLHIHRSDLDPPAKNHGSEDQHHRRRHRTSQRARAAHPDLRDRALHQDARRNRLPETRHLARAQGSQQQQVDLARTQEEVGGCCSEDSYW